MKIKATNHARKIECFAEEAARDFGGESVLPNAAVYEYAKKAEGQELTVAHSDDRFTAYTFTDGMTFLIDASTGRTDEMDIDELEDEINTYWS